MSVFPHVSVTLTRTLTVTLVVALLCNVMCIWGHITLGEHSDGETLSQQHSVESPPYHLCSNSLVNPFRSAYKPGHSTETALLKIVNDLLLSLDNGNQQRSIQLITTFYLVVLSMFFGIQVLHCNRSPPTYPTEKLSPSTTQSLILIPFRTVCLKALSLGLFCLYSIPHPSLIYCTSLDSSPLICRSHAAEKICTTTSC